MQRIRINDLTEEEILIVLEKRDKERRNADKSFVNKYLLNKHVWFDIQKSLIRECVKLMFAIYIIERFFQG